MTWFVGTSGFSYKPWKGTFYPEGIKDSEMLAYYSTRLGSVEINNTFYRMPRTEVIANWASDVPASFRFVIKASRRITHFKRLKEAGELVDYLAKATDALEDKLGAVLFQLPPNMRADLERLRTFIDLLPQKMPVVFEFRHASWFEEEVYDCLRERRIAICHADDEARDLPLVSTANWGYLRLRRPEYTQTELKQWKQRIDELGWETGFVFFKHEDEGRGPEFALTFQQLTAAA